MLLGEIIAVISENHTKTVKKPLQQHKECSNVQADGTYCNNCDLKCSLLDGLSHLSNPQVYQIFLYTLNFKRLNIWLYRIGTSNCTLHLLLLFNALSKYHISPPLPIWPVCKSFANLCLCFNKMIRLLGVETFLFGACNKVRCKFRFIIGLNYNLYNFSNVNNLLSRPTRSSLQYVIRLFT